MKTKLLNLKDYLINNYWFIPLLLTLLGLSLAIGLNSLDHFMWSKQVSVLGQSWGLNYESVKMLFSNVSATIITTMTTILSITLLIFTVLNGQYGSQVLRVFNIQPFGKFVIGWFSGTYTYIIYHIYQISINGNQDFIPQISITIGILLTLSTIFILIFYIHHLIQQIKINTIVHEVGTDLSRIINHLDIIDSIPNKQPIADLKDRTSKYIHSSPFECFGYVYSINKEELVEIAKEHQLLIKTFHRPGNFILTGETAFTLFSDHEITDALIKKIQSCFLIKNYKSPQRDIEYGFDILNEMTIRGLSPGINDIYIAKCSIDYIFSNIALLLNKKFPSPYVIDEEGNLLLVTKELSFQGIVECSLNPIRQYSSEHFSTMLHLLDNLIRLIKINQHPVNQFCLEQHYKAIYENALNRPLNQIDQESLSKRQEAFLDSTSPA